MRIFPELSTGATAQHPWRRTIRFRTVRNRVLGGQEVDLGDTPFESRTWELPLNDLRDTERQALRELLDEAGGRRLPFTFLEPGSNLLSWSEDWGKDVWLKSPGVQVLLGQSDPLGGLAAMDLSAGSDWAASQRLALAATRTLAASVWLRSSSSNCYLQLSDGLGQSKQVAVVGDGAWRLYEISWRENSVAEQVIFGVSGPGGGAVSVYGPQVEPQVGRSSYKRTTAQAGIFAGAYIDQDSMVETLTAPDQTSRTIQIQWTPSPI